MWWSDGSWGHGWWWPGIMLMAVFMIVCMVMMARMMMSHGMSSSHTENAERHWRDVPERTLANRLASGEIDIDEYERLRDALQRTTDSTRP
jgi:uncharacterized membrane protein